MSTKTDLEIENYLEEVAPEDRCDCEECVEFYARVENGADDLGPENDEEIVYDFTASELKDLLDDLDLNRDLANYYETMAELNYKAATRFHKALDYIADIPNEDFNACQHVANFARSLYHVEDLELYSDGSIV